MSRQQFRRLIRYFAALLAAATAIIYFLIGFQVISVIEVPSDQIFGLFAGFAYALGAILLLLLDQRIFWVVGSLFQVFVIAIYFNMAVQRTPAYEPWGIALRVLQVVVLLLLVFLVLRQPEEQSQRRAAA